MISKVKRLGKLELPKRLHKDEASCSATYAKYTAEPLEKGYGYTLGNVFRRVLLSSVEGGAISSLKIDNVQHEFQSIENVVEDVTDIVLNLKRVLLKVKGREPVRLLIDVDKIGDVTAKDIRPHPRVEIVNPNQKICTLSKKAALKIDLEVVVGRGYRPAEVPKKSAPLVGEISVDALFSPVTLVKYSVEDTRVGMMTDYDRLILEVWTDGRISPDEALSEASAIIARHLEIFGELSKEVVEFEEEDDEVSEEDNRLAKLLNMSVNEIELSVRAANCLNNANITRVGQLAMKSEAEMLKYRNFGKKSLNEIKEKLEKLGLSLHMKLDERLLEKANLS